MKTTKIYIKNLFGITEKQLDGKCKEKGLQFIATRTTDDDCLEVTVL